MPQLIAMIIVVVGAMIYMFQTFGGTGDKIEGIAQKSTIMTEINNIKNGVQLALRSEALHNSGSGAEDLTNNKVRTLKGIAQLQFFPEQINNQLTATGAKEYYQAISFGASDNMIIELVLPSAKGETTRPGLFVDLSKGNLATNAGFLEKQLILDLQALASIDAHQTSATYNALKADGDIASPKEAVTDTDPAKDTNTDGKFVIYFKDLPRGMIK